jgi:hypothetical protein
MGQSFSVPVQGLSYDDFVSGIRATEIPPNVVDLKATFDRYKDHETNLIPVEAVKLLKWKTDVFLTHDWSTDELGRNNHERVAAINKALKTMGIVTWFDSDRMTGDVVDQMVAGIDNASVVIVFVTQCYMNKVNGSNPHDNCRKEFKYATLKKSATKMIPVVMEPRMKDVIGNWTGLLQLELGSLLHVDFSDDNDFQTAIQQLKTEVLHRTNPLWVLKDGTASSPAPDITSPLAPPLPPPAAIPSATDLRLIEQLQSWFEELEISSGVARRYAEILVGKNTGSVVKLKKKLERNSNFLEDIGGFDEDDISDIEEKLRIGNPMDNREKTHSVLLPAPSTPAETIHTAKPKSPDQTPVSTVEALVPSSKVVVSGNSRRVSSAHSKTIQSVAWNHITNKIASGSHDSTIKVWDAETLSLFKILEGHTGSVSSVSWNTSGTRLVSGGKDKTIRVWNGETGELLKAWEAHSESVRSVAWNHGGRKIASGSEDRTIKIWDVEAGELLKTLKGHSLYVYSVSWSPDDSKIVSASWDCTFKIWDVIAGTILLTVMHSNIVNSVAWNHEGNRIVSSSYDQTVKIWDSDTGELVRTLEGHSERVLCVAWSRDDSKIASVSDFEKKIIVWDVFTGQIMNTFQMPYSGLSLCWGCDNCEIACNESFDLILYKNS